MADLTSRRARTFGAVAGEYDRIRPGYPAQLFDDVLSYATLDGRPALEIGAGTGKATVEFVARGVAVTALEPDPKMAALLEGRVAEVTVTTFEDYCPAQRFGLLYSAQAWHWTDRETRWQHAIEALTPGGTLALFWNADRPADPAIVDAIRATFRDNAPDVEPSLMPDDFGTDTYTELVEHPDFTDRVHRWYSWERRLTAEDYLALLATTSAFQVQDEATRARMLATISAPLDDEVILTGRTALALARSAATPHGV